MTLHDESNRLRGGEEIRPHVRLFRDPVTGIAWVEDGTTGSAHSAHPNIHISGSVEGMRDRGYWGRNERTVTCNGWIYNIDRCVSDDELDEIARTHCQCGGNHG